MARKKVKLVYIANDALRRITFKKRRSSLIKKVSELSTLCGVPACAVIYGPHEAAPEVWPSELEARRILQRFRELPEREQSKKAMNQEGFLQQRLRKHVEQLRKQELEIRRLEMVVRLYECVEGRGLNHVGLDDAAALLYFIDMRLKELHEVAAKAHVALGDVDAGTEAETATARAQASLTEEFAAQQMVFGINGDGGVGGMDRMVPPCMDNEITWILDPNLLNF